MADKGSPSFASQPWPAAALGRFALATFADGAVLLDLETGTFFRLNASALQLARGLVNGESAAELASRLVRSLGVSPAVAARGVASLRAQLQKCETRPSPNPICFVVEPAGYQLRWQDEPVCRIDPQGQVLTGLGGSAANLTGMGTPLLWTAPHLLALQGQIVLHASAVRQGSGVVALCGASGLGKTTLARLFAAAGKEVIAEDLVLLALGGATPEVAVDGEPAIRRWAASHAGDLVAGREIRTEELLRTAAGSNRAPLREVLFIQRTGLPTVALTRQPVGKADALVLLLENSFAELGVPHLWRRVWDGCCRLAAETPVLRLGVPEGLDRLAEAVDHYSRTVN